jgi:glycosyltransferase involved in cell wall biosynthesis
LEIRRKYKLGFPTLVFHGTYSYKPNRDAICFLAEKVMPYLRKRGIKARLLAIGDSPIKGINDPDVIFTGVVKDLPAHLKAADIAVVPIEAGGGMRIKILEYFAAKLPVVSTPFGAEGIPAKNDKEIIIATLKEFPRKVEELIKKKGWEEEIKRNAFLFIKDWSWERVMKKHIEVYKSLTNKN